MHDKAARGRFRIIGGRWRGRRFAFPQQLDIRPTPDRVRETLFNWLAPQIEGARCLDLFAGSGALGLEALSRGAAAAVFLDPAAAACAAIRAHLSAMDASDRAQVLQTTAQAYLQRGAERFDLIFLDPPYGEGLIEACLPLLPDILKPPGRVYLETLAGQDLALPAGWRLLKEKRAGQVAYYLADRQP